MNLREFAEALGLSQTTVSRALNGYPEVSDKTRERVVRAAKLHNYKPNRRARCLATGRSRRVAIVAGSGKDQGLTDPVFCAFLSGAAEVLERENFDWVIRQPRTNECAASSVTSWEYSGFEGVILAAPSQDANRLVERAPSDFPVVVRGNMRMADRSVCGLDFDHKSAMRTAIQCLAADGHQHIALVTGAPDRLQSQSQTAAFLNTMRDMGLPVSSDWVRSGSSTQEFGVSVADDFREMALSPTAVVCGCSIIASGIAARLPRGGSHTIDAPKFVYFDDGLTFVNASLSERCFGSIKTPSDVLGREIAETLLRQIRAPETLPNVRLLAPEMRLMTSPIPENPGAYGPHEPLEALHGKSEALRQSLEP